MMAIVIDANDSRSIKAIAIAATSAQWLKVRSAAGEIGWGIPSQCQPGRYYLVSTEQCDCPDSKRFGLTEARRGQQGLHAACKHQLAVRLVDELARAQQTQPRAKRRHLRALPPITVSRIHATQRED